MSTERTSDKWSLEKDPVVSRWLTRVAERRGPAGKTTSGYLISLKRFCDFTGKAPAELIAEAKKGEEGREAVHDLIAAYMSDMRRKKYAASTVRVYVMVIRSFFKHNGVVFPSLASPAGGAKAPTRPLTPEEIERVLRVADVADRALVYVMAHSGVRIGVIPRLTVGDLDAKEVPAVLRAFDEKKNQPYTTFLTGEAVEALKDYFRAREVGTPTFPPEKITADSPLIRSPKNLGAISTRTIFRRVKHLFKIAEVNGTKDRRTSPHSFRKFFHTRLTAGGMPESWSNILAGRVPEPGAGSAYQMPPIEDLRAKYGEASEAFEPEHPLKEQVEALAKNGADKSAEMEALRRQLREQREMYEERLESERAKARIEQLRMLVKYSPGILDDIEKLRQVAEDLDITREEIYRRLGGKMPLMMHKDAAGGMMSRAEFDVLRSLVLERLGLGKGSVSKRRR